MAAALIRSSISRSVARRNPRCGYLIPIQSFSSLSESAAPVHSPGQGERDGGRWSRLLLFVPGAITFGLGTWQIFRRQDKIKMLEYRQERLGMEPLKLGKVSPTSEDLNNLEFRRVSCTGVFDEKRSIFIGPRSRSISGVTENGYYLITPLMPLQDNPESLKSPVLVNRGWVPRSWRDKLLEASRNIVEPADLSKTDSQKSEGHSWWRFWQKKPKTEDDNASEVTPVEVIGVVRGNEKPSMFVPANDPSTSQWFYVDVPAIARAVGLPADTVYIEDVNEDVNPSCPYPIPKDINTLIRSSVMPQDHLNYTMTWYSLSAAVTFMAFKRLKQKSRSR
ncbi:hypothetical protein MLD38_038277 [Melastoma candidum]|uniref:Uncharacterized protein n=1 Tax=Melastoma candidum TaxID=119954 RepID=A0ACB9L0Q1_9MYRT|nr:hypothetical protein MLD38_038277 [Melastoma candidum]